MRLPRSGAAGFAGSLLARAALLGVVWWAFVEGAVGSWVLSGAAVLVAALVSLALLPPGSRRWSLSGLLRFVPFFLSQSLRSGTDVAVRAFHPRRPIRPGTIDYPLRLPEGAARVFFATSLNLLPGTLSARLGRGSLRVHLLHTGIPARERIEELEARVADLFDERI